MRTLLAAALWCSLTVSALPAQDRERAATPEVSGVGSVDVLLRPASAIILLAVTGEGLDAPTAAGELRTLLAKVNDVLKSRAERILPYGAGYGENPQRRNYPNDPGVRTTRDYLARAGIAVEVRDPGKVNELLDLLVRSGIDGVQGVMYLPDENDPALQQAVTRATGLAMNHARSMATAAGGELGPLVRIQMPQAFGFPGVLQRFQISYSSGPTVPLQASDLSARITVQGSWEFRPRR
jgi:uncharacterized protein YggE